MDVFLDDLVVAPFLGLEARSEPRPDTSVEQAGEAAAGVRWPGGGTMTAGNSTLLE